MQKLISKFTQQSTVTPVKRLFMQPVARSFNRSIKPENSGIASKLFMAAGLGGMAYLTMQSINMNKNR